MNTIRWFCTGMNRVGTKTVGMYTVMLASLETGCGVTKVASPSPQPSSTPPVQTTVTPIAAQEVNLPVKEGLMPLAYIVETTAAVKVVDLTTNHTLTQLRAPGQSIVSIDELHGISIAGNVMETGPLPADHRYGVYVDTGGFNPEDDIRRSDERTDPSILQKHNQTLGRPPTESGPGKSGPEKSGPGESGLGKSGSSLSTTSPSPHQ